MSLTLLSLRFQLRAQWFSRGTCWLTFLNRALKKIFFYFFLKIFKSQDVFFSFMDIFFFILKPFILDNFQFFCYIWARGGGGGRGQNLRAATAHQFLLTIAVQIFCFRKPILTIEIVAHFRQFLFTVAVLTYDV